MNLPKYIFFPKIWNFLVFKRFLQFRVPLNPPDKKFAYINHSSYFLMNGVTSRNTFASFVSKKLNCSYSHRVGFFHTWSQLDVFNTKFWQESTINSWYFFPYFKSFLDSFTWKLKIALQSSGEIYGKKRSILILLM